MLGCLSYLNLQGFGCQAQGFLLARTIVAFKLLKFYMEK